MNEKFNIKVISNSKEVKIKKSDYPGIDLEVKVRAIAQKGAANIAVKKHLAKYFGIKKSQINILKGKLKNIKIIEVVH